MRYFKTTNASRRYTAGRLAFTFEPVSNIGGSWLGVLAVEDNSAASTIAAAALPQVQEISQEIFEDLKKKPQSNPHFLASREVPPSSRQHPVVGHVVRAASTSTAKPVVEETPASAQLATAILDVPDELRLEGPAPKPKPRQR